MYIYIYIYLFWTRDRKNVSIFSMECSYSGRWGINDSSPHPRSNVGWVWVQQKWNWNLFEICSSNELRFSGRKIHPATCIITSSPALRRNARLLARASASQRSYHYFRCVESIQTIYTEYTTYYTVYTNTNTTPLLSALYNSVETAVPPTYRLTPRKLKALQQDYFPTRKPMI